VANRRCCSSSASQFTSVRFGGPDRFAERFPAAARFNARIATHRASPAQACGHRPEPDAATCCRAGRLRRALPRRLAESPRAIRAAAVSELALELRFEVVGFHAGATGVSWRRRD